VKNEGKQLSVWTVDVYSVR